MNKKCGKNYFCGLDLGLNVTIRGVMWNEDLILRTGFAVAKLPGVAGVLNQKIAGSIFLSIIIGNHIISNLVNL